MRYGGYDGGWPPYVSVAERRLKAEREIAKLRKKGQKIEPVVIEGRTIARTFWGKAWGDNLESYDDFAYRLERGRSYARNGLVIDLRIAEREVTAMVAGSSIYRVTVGIDAVAKPQWRSICQDCAGGIDSLIELLQGRLSQGVMERLCRQELGLFPKPKEIRFKCSCPDYASMCKHVAAVLCGVGARLDHQPELLFRLRAVDEKDLVTGLDQALPVTGKGPPVARCWSRTTCRRCSAWTWPRPNQRRRFPRHRRRRKPRKAEATPRPGRQQQAAARRKEAAKPKRRAVAQGLSDLGMAARDACWIVMSIRSLSRTYPHGQLPPIPIALTSFPAARHRWMNGCRKGTWPGSSWR